MASTAGGCPVLLEGSNLAGMVGFQRDSISLFHLAQGEGEWIRNQIQVDSRGADGRLKFADRSKSNAEAVSWTDRILFYPTNFGRQRNPNDQLPCNTPFLLELIDGHHPHLRIYVAACGGENPKLTQFEAPRISNDQVTITSPHYRYQLNRSNHLLFDEIATLNFDPLKGAEQDSATKLAKKSEILIHADFKNFVTLGFHSDDLESRVEATDEGPIALSARLSFFLRILFFQVKLQLTTDISFFADSGNIPMILYAPTNAKSVLNKPSGLIYVWSTEPGVSVTSDNMPVLGSRKVANWFADTKAQQLDNRCGADSCQYSVKIEQRDQAAALRFMIPSKLVARGFFPFFLDDATATAKEFGWDLSKNGDHATSRRQGFYFETSELPAGEHHWDLWYQLGKIENNLIENGCPYPVTRGPLLRFETD